MTNTASGLTDRQMQELRLFLVLPGPMTVITETRRELVRLGVLGQYGRTGTFYVTELGHDIAQGVWQFARPVGQH